MVKLQPESESDRLDALVRAAAEKHGLVLDVQGWARRTYEVQVLDARAAKSTTVARVETLAARNGEIQVFDDRGLEFAQTLGAALEGTFGLTEAVILRVRP